MAKGWPLLFLFLAAIAFNKADAALLAIFILGTLQLMLGPTIAVRQEPIFLTMASIFLTLDPLEGSVMDLTVLIFLLTFMKFGKENTPFYALSKYQNNVIPLAEQIQQFPTVQSSLMATMGHAATEKFLSKSLFFISIGSNDIFGYYHSKSSLSKQDFMGCLEELNDHARAIHAMLDSLLCKLSSEFEGMEDSLDFTECRQKTTSHWLVLLVKNACFGVGKFNAESIYDPKANLCLNRKDLLDVQDRDKKYTVGWRSLKKTEREKKKETLGTSSLRFKRIFPSVSMRTGGAPTSSLDSSSTTPWKYDVFLSFRGIDTRKRHFTFRDNEGLERGKYISMELLKSIEESRFAIVIFSKNYAFSTWCLDELAKIVKCMKETGLTVLPIFYDVDPCDVRKQMGTFEQAFNEHAERFKENIEKIETWRFALREVGSLSGWHLQDSCDNKPNPNLESYSKASPNKALVYLKNIDEVDKRCTLSSIPLAPSHQLHCIMTKQLGAVKMPSSSSHSLKMFKHNFEEVEFQGVYNI
ncbi:hypothetical protein SO802_027863 [Lithocarpus litseifolius]|uniref:TIR domain-containing protein n=1 Tax=Lithocarpus litseifolius TaxID=425828 RepID=A0AAW2BNQ4_9ROSI